jgi:hypothetical protein
LALTLAVALALQPRHLDLHLEIVDQVERELAPQQTGARR